jgi:hypothetical protein
VDDSIVYNCCWPSPAQSFPGLNPAGLMTIFYCLRFESLPTWRDMSPYLYPPGTGWPSYTPRHWVPFSSPPTTRRATVEVFEPACSLYSLGADQTENTAFNSSSIFVGFFTDPLPINGRLLIRLLHGNGCTRYNTFGHRYYFLQLEGSQTTCSCL